MANNKSKDKFKFKGLKDPLTKEVTKVVKKKGIVIPKDPVYPPEEKLTKSYNTNIVVYTDSEMVAKIDTIRGDTPRSTWVKNLINKEITKYDGG